MAEIRTFTTGNDEAADGQDLAVFIRSLLEQMTGRFNHMSTNIINRMDEMESRIDDLEKSIAELMQQAGVDTSVTDRSTDVYQSINEIA